MKKLVIILFMASSVLYGQSYHLNVNLNNGKTVSIAVTDIQKLLFTNLTEINDTANQQPVQTFQLLNNYPNPFNPTTTIEYQIPENSTVTVSVFDINGKLVKNLVKAEQNAGLHQIAWDGTNQNGIKVASGIYIYLVKAGNLSSSKTMILLK